MKELASAMIYLLSNYIDQYRVNKQKYNYYSGYFAKARKYYFYKAVGAFNAGGREKILDVGCGQGDFLAACKDIRVTAMGIDADGDYINFCKKRGYNVKIGDIYRIPYRKESYDGVFSQSVFEHLTDPLKAIGEINRVLKPGGLVIISTPTPSSSFWDDPTHVRPHTPKSLRLMLEMGGFKNISVSYVLFYLLGLNIGWNWLYRFINMIPIAMGSNIIAFAKKPDEK